MGVKKRVLYLSIVITMILLFICYTYREDIVQKHIRWKKSAKIVMFGDSHTAHGEWSFTLNTNPVLRSGWAGYTSEMLTREIASVTVYNPKFVFILCGGNDIYHEDFSVKNTMENFKIIAALLQEHEITPVFQKLIYQHNNPEFNKVIDTININLVDYCKMEKIPILDISDGFYDLSGLKTCLTTDNLHLNQKGYDLWSDVINDYLKNEEWQ